MNSDKRRNLITILLLSLLLLLLHVTALKLYLYWTTWWMDIINHFVGGILLAFIFSPLLSKDRLSGTSRFWVCLGIALAFGLLWEIFELAFGLTSGAEIGYATDTLLDLLMDISGMLVVLRFFINSKSNS